MADDLSAHEARLVAMERELAELRRRVNRRSGARVFVLAGVMGLGAVAFGEVAAGPLTVRAPFVVEDEAGQQIMSVATDRVLRLSTENETVIELRPLVVDGKPSGEIQIGAEMAGPYVLLGADKARAGLSLHTLEGNIIASLSGEDLAGSVLSLNSMYQSAGAVVMSQNKEGGVIEVKRADGASVVWAGVMTDGTGAVRAGPASGGAAAAANGGAASSIEGRKN